MTNETSLVGSLLSEVLGRSLYVYFLALHVSQVAVRVGNVAMLLALNRESGEISLQASVPDQARPTFWVECKLAALELAAKERRSVSEVVIRTGPIGQSSHPRVEQLLIRCFQVSPFPIDDREDLIYPALFGFAPPRTVWESKTNLLRVLHYSGPHGSFCVSSGFSEPWVWQPAEVYDEHVSGAGYELVLKSSDPALIGEFLGWVTYIEQSKAHLLPGNWLEYETDKLIPGIDVAGFLVVRPTTILPHFPVGSAIAHWHSLVPVSAGQLNLAKQTNAFDVTKVMKDKL